MFFSFHLRQKVSRVVLFSYCFTFVLFCPQRALAAGLFGGLGGLGGGGTSNSGSSGLVQVEANFTGVEEQLATLNGNVATSNVHLADGVGQMGVANGHLGAGVEQLHGIQTQMGGLNEQAAAANAHLEGFGHQLDTANGHLDQINANWSHSNALVEQMLNPANAFLLAMGAGTGFAVAGIAVHLLFKGLVAAGKALHEAITHEKRDARILELFLTAQTEYRKTTSSYFEIEARIDSFLYVLEAMEEAGGSEELAKNLSISIHGLRAMKTLIERETIREFDAYLDNPPQNETLSSVVSSEVQEMVALTSSQLERLEKLKTAVESIPLDRACQIMQMDIDVLTQTQDELQRARTILLDPMGQRIWQSAWADQMEETFKYAKRIQDPKNYDKLQKKRSKEEKRVFKMHLKSDAELYVQVRETWKRCLSEKSRFGNVWLIGKLASRNARQACWEAATNPNSAYAASYSDRLMPHYEMKQAAQKACDLSDQACFTDFYYNPRVTGSSLANHYEFFQRIQKEQTQQSTSWELDRLLKKKERVERLCGSLSDLREGV